MKTGMSLGEKIKYLRKRLSLTQQELAGDNFTKSFISQIEKNEANPSLKSLQVISSRLGKPVSFFLDESQGVDDLERSPKVDQLNLLGQGFARNRDWLQAINCYEQALELCSTSDFQRRGTCLYNLGVALWHNQETTAACTKLQEAVAEFQLTQNTSGLVSVHNLLGVLYGDLNYWEESTQYLEQALGLLENHELEDEHLKLRILTNLGLGLCRLHRLEEARTQINQALHICNETTDYYKFGELQMALGYIDQASGDLESSLAATKKAESFFQAVGPQTRLLDVFLNLAIIHGALNTPKDIESGLNYLDQAQEIIEKYDFEESRGNIYEEYGHLLLKKGQQERAVIAYQRALIYQKDSTRKAKLHLALASAFRDGANLEQANRHLEEAGKALDQPKDGDYKQLAELYSDLGLFYKELNNPAQANNYLSKSVEIYRGL